MKFLSYRWLVWAMGVLMAVVMVHGASQAQETGYYSPDMLAMQGRWVRTDAPYIIELRQGKSKKLQATYFNRRYINVEKTETAEQNGLHYVMIRLQDVNYQGSMYLLSYNREGDTIDGVYIHGASGQRYQVIFTRQTASK